MKKDYGPEFGIEASAAHSVRRKSLESRAFVSFVSTLYTFSTLVSVVSTFLEITRLAQIFVCRYVSYARPSWHAKFLLGCFGCCEWYATGILYDNERSRLR